MQRERFQRAINLLRRPALVSLAGNGATSAIGLLTLALLARWLSPPVFGAWMLFQTGYNLFDMVRNGLLLNALIQHTAGLTDEAAFRRWAGAVWQVGLGVSIAAGLGLILVSAGIPAMQTWSGERETAFWFALLGVVSFPAAVAGWLLHARSQFLPLQAIRLLTQLLFLGLVASAYLGWTLTITDLFAAFTIANGLVSVLAIAMGWSYWADWRAGTGAERRHLFRFGKYSLGTLLGANLLRSSDVFLLGAFLGPSAVALYVLPQRMIQLLETPIRSIVVTDIPRLTELHRQGKPLQWAAYFHRCAGRLWFLLLPISLIAFIAAEPLVVLLGGETYRDGALLLRIFMLQGALLPLDRYSGVGLDAINRPGANLSKVLVMLAVTIGGDLLALSVFESVVAVSIVALLTFTTGLVLGFRLLERYVPVSLGETLQTGWNELRILWNRVSHANIH